MTEIARVLAPVFSVITGLQDLDEVAAALPSRLPDPLASAKRSGRADRFPDGAVLSIGSVGWILRKLRTLCPGPRQTDRRPHHANRASAERTPIGRMIPVGAAGLEAAGASLAAAEVPRS